MNGKSISVFSFIVLCNKINASYLGNVSFTHHHCKTPNLKSWIYFPYDVCVHLVINENQYPTTCIEKLINSLTAIGVTSYQKSSGHIKGRNVFHQNKTECESYLLVMENPQEWFENTIHQLNRTQKIFYPFTRLYFMSLYANDFQLFGNLTRFLYRNAFFGYKFNFHDNGEVVSSLHDVVNNSTLKSSPNFTDLSHPLLDTKNHNREFRASVFNCPPHIIFLDKNGSRKDGLEYRFLTHVLKNWKIRFLHQNESVIPYDPFGSMISQLAQGQTDMIMCGIWLHIMHHPNRDLTSYFDYNCNTWIAPKPKKLDPATLIYLTLSTAVWGVYISCFVFTVALLTIISKIEEGIKKTKIVSSHFGRSLLEATNTATSHGIVNFPKQISVQILLVSWILLNLLVGLGYTTVYTSRLTRPGFTKPIDTFEDFVEQGISWITRHQYEPVLKTLNESTRPAFNNIYKNLISENSEEQLVKSLRTGRFGVFMSIRSHKYAVDIERILHPNATGIWDLFRFMKVCFYSHFSTFALSKPSPYTTLFNAHIRRYQECGIIKHWYVELYRDQKWMETLFEAHPKYSNEPSSLTLWDMKGAFFVLLTGLSIAIFSYLIELTCVQLKKLY